MHTCSISECNKPHLAKGFCSTHYQRWKTYGNAQYPLQRIPGRLCSISGCNKPYSSKGMCKNHYSKWRRATDPEHRERRNAMERKRRQSQPNGYQYGTLRQRYGITVDELAAMEASQKGLCASCHQKPKRLVIDHCHSTGKVRGLLCDRCNTIAGVLEDERRMAVQEYLSCAQTTT